MRSSVSRLRTERKQTLRAAVLAVLFCLFLAGCGDDVPDLSRDSVKRTAAPAAETEFSRQIPTRITTRRTTDGSVGKSTGGDNRKLRLGVPLLCGIRQLRDCTVGIVLDCLELQHEKR